MLLLPFYDLCFYNGAFEIMKYTHIAAAILASAITTSVSASNWVSVNTDMVAYVSAGIGAQVTQQLIFPDVVKPSNAALPVGTTAAISSSVSVAVNPDGTVVYTGDSAPGGGAASQEEQNATGNNVLGQRTHSAGKIAIIGEPGYAISVQISPDTASGNIPLGMGFVAKFSANSTSSTSNFQLDSDGNLEVSFGGELTVDHDFALTPGLETSMTLVATINYRS